ncbi:MAG: hypothetical protein JW395_4019 [Nitrospira sp.]|nr:hypothetical protein [Nitrospira sp.]
MQLRPEFRGHVFPRPHNKAHRTLVPRALLQLLLPSLLVSVFIGWFGYSPLTFSSLLVPPLKGEVWIYPLLRASNEGWSIWSIWLVGPEIHPEEPDRPEKPANETDEPGRVARAQKIIRLHPPFCSASTRDRPDHPLYF